MTDRIDDAIDRAVREMLGVEPRADLQARVMDRIEGHAASAFDPARVASTFDPARVASTFRWKIWIAGPLAAAAVLVLAVWAPWRQMPVAVVPAPSPSIANAEPAADVALRLPPQAPAPRHEIARRHPGATRSVRAAESRLDSRAGDDRIVTAAAAEGTIAIEPLDVVVPIEVLAIGSTPIAPREVAVAPLPQVAELQIAPLSTPNGRF